MVQDEHPEIFDFLYADEDRLRSFYSQVFSGSLERITTQYRTDTTSEKSVSVGPGSLKGQRSGGESVGQQTEYVSVPEDVSHIDVLTKLKGEGFYQSTLDEAQIGQLVSLENTSISIIDASNLHDFLNAVPIADAVSGTKHERREQEKNLKLAKSWINALYKMIPVGIQVHCLTETGQRLWGTLKNDFLREHPASLSLKHGSQLQGKWRVIGIVDAVPGTGHTNLSGNAVRAAFSNLHNEMRNQLGRSDDEFGFSPFLIFRDVQK